MLCPPLDKGSIMTRLVFVLLALAIRAGSAVAQPVADEGYAEDYLRAEAEEAAAEISSRCGNVSFSGKQILSGQEATAALCTAVAQLPLALSVIEHGAAERAEIITGALLQSGVPVAALGQVLALPEKPIVIVDESHGDTFYKAWQLVFGNEYPRKILLMKGDDELWLDVNAEVEWQRHSAATVWIEGNPPQLHVLDPVVSPDKPLTLDAWRELTGGSGTTVLWEAAGSGTLDIRAEYLPDAALQRLKRHLQLASTDAVEIEATNQMLRELDSYSKAEIYAQILGAEPPVRLSAVWTGDAESADKRIHAALSRVELLLAYHEMRSSFPSDEEFLQEVKRRMLANSKKPKQVQIVLDDVVRQ